MASRVSLPNDASMERVSPLSPLYARARDADYRKTLSIIAARSKNISRVLISLPTRPYYHRDLSLSEETTGNLPRRKHYFVGIVNTKT